jgi:hypothetical protein
VGHRDRTGVVNVVAAVAPEHHAAAVDAGRPGRVRLPLDGVGDRAGRAQQTLGQAVDLDGAVPVDLEDDLEGTQGELDRPGQVAAQARGGRPQLDPFQVALASQPTGTSASRARPGAGPARGGPAT